ncbi:hypothetical protein EF326P1_00039 [Enterococcus phage EF326P1]|nr:hypothetical protein EF326P1_00039 [Enterococcus phage EF326P1]
MKLHDEMVVKRKDNGLKGVAYKLEGDMWKVKYHDGTHTYTTDAKIEKLFVLPEVEVTFEDDSKSDGVEDDVEVYFEESKHDSDLIDNQIHYTVNGLQPIEILKANMTPEQYYGFLLGNLQKYISRHEYKNKVEDLRKAKTYLCWMIEEWENGRKQ